MSEIDSSDNILEIIAHLIQSELVASSRWKGFHLMSWNMQEARVRRVLEQENLLDAYAGQTPALIHLLEEWGRNEGHQLQDMWRVAS